MARLYLKKTLNGFAPADEPSAELVKKYKLNEVYRAEVVKPRSYKHHCLCFALLTLTFNNQERYTNFSDFRKAVALAAGHSYEYPSLDGDIVREAASLSYDSLDEAGFSDLFPKLMAVCCQILKDINADELEAEVSRYAGTHYGAYA